MGVAVVCVADGLQAAIAVVDLSLALNVPIHDQLSRDYGLRSVNCHGVRSLNGNRRVFSFHYDPGSGEVNLSPQIIENAYLAILESRGAAASVGDAESDRVLSVTRQGGRKHFSPRFSLGSEAVRFEMLDIITQVAAFFASNTPLVTKSIRPLLIICRTPLWQGKSFLSWPVSFW